MKAKLVAFGRLEIDGQRYEDDVVIEAGQVSKRSKKLSKPYRDRYGHTPLSAEEPIPWGGARLIVGTGIYGRLPIMKEVYEQAAQRGVEIVAMPTKEACCLLSEMADESIHAVLHITC